MAESERRKVLLKALRPLHGVFVENVMHSGMADINYVEGWLELKWLAKWPVKAETPVKLPKFTGQQRAFLNSRCNAGGDARLMLCVGREWILLPGIWSALHLGKGATRAEVLSAAEKHWLRGLKGAELVDHLRRNLPSNTSALSSVPENVVILNASGSARTSIKPPPGIRRRSGARLRAGSINESLSVIQET